MASLKLTDWVDNEHTFQLKEGVTWAELWDDPSFDKAWWEIEYDLGVLDLNGGDDVDVEYATDTETKEDFDKIVEALNAAFGERLA